MRYALTFTTDVNDSWGTTDTIIFEADLTTDGGVAKYTKQELDDLVYDILKAYGVEGAEIIATSGWWYLRNCEDIDIRVEKGKDKVKVL